MGANFVKGRVSGITETDDGNLILRYEDIESGGGLAEAEHDLVVLAVGVQPNRDARTAVRRRRARARRVLLRRRGRRRPRTRARPTSRACSSPARPPGPRTSRLHPPRGRARSAQAAAHLERKRRCAAMTRPQDRRLRLPVRRQHLATTSTWTGGRRGRVASPAWSWRGRRCSPAPTPPSRRSSRNRGAELDGIVVASCSPKLHTVTFREVAKRAGLNPYQYTQVNLREQCSWAHTDDQEGATGKAVRLVRAGIARTRLTEPLEPIVVETVPQGARRSAAASPACGRPSGWPTSAWPSSWSRRRPSSAVGSALRRDVPARPQRPGADRRARSKRSRNRPSDHRLHRARS